jgi:hypothetical protein
MQLEVYPHGRNAYYQRSSSLPASNGFTWWEMDSFAIETLCYYIFKEQTYYQ